jgi:3-oxoadipate enol-lactonase
MMLAGDGAELFYEVRGEGPDVVLLHPYPCDHSFWLPMAPHLESRFRLIMPDLRGLGRSGCGAEVAKMELLVSDVLGLCDELKIGRATFVGCSIGGYVLFELWRRSRQRVKSLVLMDTKAVLDGEEGRAARLQNAKEILERGPQWAIDQMLPRLLSPVTIDSRPEVVKQARAAMRQATAQGMAALQRGMAERADSTATMAAIDVPTLVLGGEDDAPSPVSELERMAHGIRGAELKIISRAGHLAALEQPDDVGTAVREFLERHGR